MPGYLMTPQNPPYVMKNVDPSVFQVLWDWTYVRTVAAHYNTAFEDDYFWYLVFKMAEGLDVP